MEPTEYLVLHIDSACLDTHNRIPSVSSRSGAALSNSADFLSNTSSHSLSSSTSTSTTNSTTTSHSSASSHLSPPRKNYNRSSRSKSKSASASRSRSESRSSNGSGPLTSILRLAGLNVLTADSFDSALTYLERRLPTENRPVLLLVDVDTELELTSQSSGSYSTRHHRPPPSKNTGRNSGIEDPTVKALQGNGQRHPRATNDNTVPKGSLQQNRRLQAKPLAQNTLDGSLCGLDFLETVLQGLAKGNLRHIVPIAMSSTTSQERITELFNLGVADVLLKPIEEQVARTLFLDFPSMSSRAAQERVEELKNRLLSWDFHPHDLCEEDLMRCVVIVIQEVMKLDGLGDLNIPEHLLHRFVIGLRDSYHRSNPYHNFAHAVDVLQATFYFLCRMGKLPGTGIGLPPISLTNGTMNGSVQEPETSESSANIPTQTDSSTTEGDNQSFLRIQDFLRPEDIFALVVASIGHDVGHPGVNNMFL
ncbi:3',5'-cyclic-nucleotide phosphodiesterase, partial [Entomortierella lignicola]